MLVTYQYNPYTNETKVCYRYTSQTLDIPRILKLKIFLYMRLYSSKSIRQMNIRHYCVH